MEKLLTKGKTKTLFGVCSGIAEYLNVDVSIIRILFVLVSLFWGFGIVIYLVAALILPEHSIEPNEPTNNP